jgi:hypothetical protein
MRRYHAELPRTLRTHRKHMRWFHGWPEKPVDCACDLQAGRFYKQSWHGYHNPRCYLCHGAKLLGIPSRRDLIARDRERDSRADYVEKET